MYRVLVVDDEPYVVDWICMLIETKVEKEIDVCRAYTAAEALDWLMRTRIDIVISDISMPGMNGLELADQVRSRWPFSKVILVTAHMEFDYALTAIRSNVASYILKTQGDDMILKELERVIDLVEQEWVEKFQSLTSPDIRLRLPELKNSFFREMLVLGITDEKRVERQLETFHLSLRLNTPVLLILGEIKEWDQLDNPIERQASVERLMELVKIYASDCGTLYAVDMGGRRIAWLLQENSKTDQRQQSVLIQGRLEMLQNICMDQEEASISFTIYAKVIPLKELAEAYRSLDVLMNRMFGEREPFVIYGGEEIGNWKVDTEKIHKQANLLLEEKRFEEFADRVSYYKRLAGENHLSVEDCYHIYYSLALAIHFYADKQEFRRDEKWTDLEANLFLTKAEEKWENKFSELEAFSESVFAEEQGANNTVIGNTVDVIKAYVSDHITEDISLTRLSEVTGYNTCYISRIFKENTKENLSEYIGRKKMKYIEKLIRETDLNISDVAERAGFVSRTYFNRFIRKYTGMSPKDYKQSLDK